jgi:Kef-type K+ transport system membrane component KefB
MTFGTLALIVAAGLAGPILSGWRSARVPLVVGQIVAGVIIGRTGFGWINPAQPTLAFLSQVGFAMLMFVVGTHLPLRDPRLRPAAGRAVAATALTFGLAAAVALVLAHLTSVHRSGLLLVLLATSSAAVALPVIAEQGLEGEQVLTAMAWIAAADVSSIAAVPLVLEPGRALRVTVGAVVVTLSAAAIWIAAVRLRRQPFVPRLRTMSHDRNWALDLRLSLVGLFVLAWMASRFGTGTLVAGFSAGAVLALVGEPRRLAQQLLGLADGFFVPLFFVTLGAQLDARGLVSSPRTLILAAAIAGAALAVHVAVAAALRLPPAAGLLADAQMGVPAAVASLGLDRGLLTPGQAAAVIAAALVSLVACAAGAAALAGRQAPREVAAQTG